MDDDSSNLQNEFFNQARKERKIVTVFLGSGKRLLGRIKAFDKFTLLLDGPQGEQMIFKHAISTVSAGAQAEAGLHEEGNGEKKAGPAGGTAR